ncbi:zf-HC2 domain-containing protein [Streptomyces sp. NPDC000151]|uniref:zf-HC2 domain-containing protein n=1 Tax=Streptomyces sp. NPDC000151 TaxID=3154244 RepID=UPI00331F97D1
MRARTAERRQYARTYVEPDPHEEYAAMPDAAEDTLASAAPPRTKTATERETEAGPGETTGPGTEASLSTGAEESAEAAATAYAHVYEKEHARLVAYARTLASNAWLAEDLVAEAHFRVWRRIRSGARIDNVPAYLRTTIKHLAATVGAAEAREVPQDPGSEHEWPQQADRPGGGDPQQRVAYVGLLSQVLDQLPERWVTALWLSEAEGQPLETVGEAIGAGRNATAVLLHRAREGMRQAFLRALPGQPDEAKCSAHWDRMPAFVRGEATPKQAEGLHEHVDGCADCRARVAQLTEANHRLPALTGPALLALVAGGGAKFLLPLLGAAGAGAGAAHSGAGGHVGGSVIRSVRHLLRGDVKQAGPAGVAAGVAVVAVACAAVAAGLGLTGSDQPTPRHGAVSQGPEAPPRSEGGGTGGGGGTGSGAAPAKQAATEKRQATEKRPAPSPSSRTASVSVRPTPADPAPPAALAPPPTDKPTRTAPPASPPPPAPDNPATSRPSSAAPRPSSPTPEPPGTTATPPADPSPTDKPTQDVPPPWQDGGPGKAGDHASPPRD